VQSRKPYIERGELVVQQRILPCQPVSLSPPFSVARIVAMMVEEFSMS
jgi:hypothetical protein